MFCFSIFSFQVVVINACQIANMDDLFAALPQLSSLTIQDSEWQQLPPINPELTNLCLRNCSITQLPGNYFSGSKLIIIEVTDSRLTEVPDLQSIQDTIEFIDLSNNFINDTKMLKGHFKVLTVLHLSNNLIQSFVMPLPSSWPKLIHIFLVNNRIVQFDMPIHYQNIQIYLTNNPLSCSSATTWSQDCQPGENSKLPSLHCPRHVTLIGITCYHPTTAVSTHSHSVLISIDLSLLMTLCFMNLVLC